MKQDYLLQLLSTFEEKDWNDCRNFLLSPIYNQKKLPVRLFELYAKEAHRWKELTTLEGGWQKALSHHRIWESLYPGQAYRDQRLRRVAMELKQLLQAFAQTRTQGNVLKELEKDLDLLQFLLERNALDLFVQQISKTDKKVAQLPFRDGSFHLLRLRLEKIRNDYSIRNHQTSDSFELVSEELDAYFLAGKLETFCSMLTRQKRFSKSYTLGFEQEVLLMARQMSADKFPSVAIWLAMYDLERGLINPQQFEELSSMVESLKTKLPAVQLRQVRGYMFNFLARKNVPATRYGYARMFSLCQQMLDEGTLHFAGRITGPFFRAYAHSACLAGEVEAAQEFLTTEGPNLAGGNREELLAYFQLMTAFFQQKYRFVLGKIAQNKFSTSRYEIQARVLQLQSWFELGEDDAYLRGVAAFRKYLSRKEFEGERFTLGLRAFARLGERLGKLEFLGMGSPAQLEKDVQAVATSERLWLLEKLGVEN